ncbi:acyl-CoA dehydrogenase family protein [Egicoccus halophilus]|uniref:Acyl-CoA dehydrogenase n=1 Tax=Egicoccus halophilus TaxID=1670830 RepID=A0A8J3AGF7_9ACTN|nr:acyl-CoA dehydrogenase family protein [Egicoccus halophilus]GGI08827.1 acyl-CoA dehydrogenase [Egicoccus halophilus]
MSTELDALRQTVRDFCDAEIRPHARQRDREESYPAELLPGLAELGILGAAIPEEYGGVGLDPAGYRVVIEELGAADSSIRSLVSVNVGLVGKSIVRWGTEEQKQRWLPGLCVGELGAFGLTEPGAGSNPSQMTTRAVRDGDGWVIDGAKIFITNGSRGAVTKIFARAVVDGEDRGITCFLVPQDTPGYGGRAIHGKLGLRAGDTAEIFLERVRVGDDAVLGEVGGGMKVALSALDDGRFSLASGAAGLAREALEVSLRYAEEREQFGSPIASKQLVQELLAAMHVDVQACRGLLDQVVAKLQTGERATLEISTAKLFCTEASVRCADRAVQVHGGYGYIDEYPVQRMLRDARVTTLYEGTSQVQHLIIGRMLTGHNAF